MTVKHQDVFAAETVVSNHNEGYVITYTHSRTTVKNSAETWLRETKTASLKWNPSGLSQDAVLMLKGLINSRRFLAQQLAWEEKLMSDEDMDTLADAYFAGVSCSETSGMIGLAKKLASALPNEVDADIIGAALECSADVASKIFSKAVKRLVVEECDEYVALPSNPCTTV